MNTEKVSAQTALRRSRAPRAASAPRARRSAPARQTAEARKPRRVLVPVDGSANCLRAIEHVAKRSRADGIPLQVTVVNVQPRVPRSGLLTRSLVHQHYSTQSEAALAPVRKLLTRHKLNADVRVLIGDPAPTIVDIAERTRASSIVMGTRGVGGLKALLLGSVTAKVIQLSKIPVTVVP